MRIESPDQKRTISEYDIVFDGGMTLSVTIDPLYKDELHITDSRIFISLAPKPSLNDPTKVLPGEEINIFQSKVCYVQRRDREVIEPSAETKATWYKEFNRINGDNSAVN